jgi:methylase of polypeptide subunit release factors
MNLSGKQRRALKRFKSLLIAAGMHELMPAHGPEEGRTDAAPPDLSLIAEPLHTIARLFVLGQPVESARLESHLPAEVISTLEALGLVKRNGDMVAAGEYRLVSHLGLFLFCHLVSPRATLYYGNDSLVLSRLLLPAQGRVLDLCAGVGAQALVCAQTAASVTAVDVEPLAKEVFEINAELNGLSGRVEYLVGDLYEPIAGRQFDLICCNPPFMPVPPGIRFPVFADGGPDGLALVRRVLAGLPEVLAPGGRCQVVGAVLGNDQGPELSSFEQSAADAHLAITISCPSCEELDSSMLASCSGTAMAGGGGADAKDVFRAHFERLGATRLYYLLLSATHASQPSVYFVHDDVQRVSIGPVVRSVESVPPLPL